MGQARRGRPRKAGARNAKGRLIVLPDRGNAVVQARAAMFARFQSGRADQQVGDQIGRAWAAGLLDGMARDAAMLRDIGRRYGGLYWHQFAALAPKTGQLERRDRTAANDGDGQDNPGEYFAALDALAHKAGREAVAAMHSLCVDGWWFPDTDAPWVARLVSSAVENAGGRGGGDAATAADRAKMQAAAEALLAMVEGR
ncbi:MAG TPA: hypothetical protein VK533_07740 [Sphingomonas sp.]|uniref:hypothetical protein n=1 Tax=Sphingomonas sp. TaxID=28214 RepID=UPI002C1F512D|nr:hypothetical protein [Sphingomonas sp.]HMI19419.1 hypothetical protein [Sphingomonas sp.]